MLPAMNLCLLACKVPRPTIETLVSPQLRRVSLLVGHPVRCRGFCIAFVGVHAFAGYGACSGLIPLYVVRFPRDVGPAISCSHDETSFGPK